MKEFECDFEIAVATVANVAISRNRIITTAGSDEKIEFCKSQGATHGINYKTENFKDKVMEITNNRGVDCLVDFVGASYWDSNIGSMAMDGRMCMLAFLGKRELSPRFNFCVSFGKVVF